MLPNPIAYHFYTGRAIPASDFYSYVVAANGVFKVAACRHFETSVPVARCRLAGLANWTPPAFRLLRPKVPLRWLLSVLNHARQAGIDEQMYHFHYLPDSGWRVSLPRQTTTPGSVVYHGGEDRNIALDLHSHHRMPARFSATDNGDEQGLRLYAVIGNIFSKPTLAVRVGVWGTFYPLPVETVFEECGPFMDALEVYQ